VHGQSQAGMPVELGSLGGLRRKYLSGGAFQQPLATVAVGT